MRSRRLWRALRANRVSAPAVGLAGSTSTNLVAIDNSEIESRRDYFASSLRASRSAPPGRAEDDRERHAIYGAALQQFDELLMAAKSVGPSSRPLLLFYALSQGGRAIVAARGDRPHFRAHGLSEDRTVQTENLLHRRIKRAPKGDHDAFGAVSRATQSGDLTGSVDLGAVWAAVPAVHRLPGEAWRSEWRLALDVDTNVFVRNRRPGVNLAVISFSGNPLVEDSAVFAGGRYPTLPPDAECVVRPRSGDLGPGNWIADVTLPISVDEREDAVLDRVAPRVYGQDRALVPTLPGQSQLLSTLMLWWVLLFGLSVFARYHPALWAAALDVQRSKQAVPLEVLLDQAADRLPALIYEAIFQGPADT